MTMKYFLMKNIIKLSHEELSLSAKHIGTKLPTSDDKHCFGWQDRTFTESGVKRRVMDGWFIVDDNQKELSFNDFKNMLGECEIQFFFVQY